MSTVLPVTDDDFATLVLESDRPVLVDFWAPWCAPCTRVAPLVAELAAEHPHALVVSVNVDEAPKAAAAAGISSIPTLSVYRGGTVVAQAVGALYKGVLDARLSPALAP